MGHRYSILMPMARTGPMDEPPPHIAMHVSLRFSHRGVIDDAVYHMQLPLGIGIPAVLRVSDCIL